MGMILVRYGEIALKGKNRSTFTRQLRRNIRAALKASGMAGEVREEGRRMYVFTDDTQAALEPLQRVFGVVSLSPVSEVERSIEAMRAEALRMAEVFGLTSAHTFHTDSRRADKTFLHTSPEINRLVGGVVQEATHARVDLSEAADLRIGIELQAQRVLMYGQVVPGPGGMPLPTGGRAVGLLSGGIDSPVAIWMMMKRGCGVIPVHFSQNAEDTEKVIDNCRVLERWAYGWNVRPMIVSHAEVLEPTLRRLDAMGAGRWACIFCKRAMLMKAAEIAGELHCHALVMGDSLGQVASQTLENIQIISQGIPLPILRPLIGMDKTEITQIARRIDTFDISTRCATPCPYLPDKPVTQGKEDAFQELLAELERP